MNTSISECFICLTLLFAHSDVLRRGWIGLRIGEFSIARNSEPLPLAKRDETLSGKYYFRILDSERNFNGSADPMITADHAFIHILGPDFGFCLLGSSDRGSQRSQRSPGNLTFSLLSAGCYAVEKMTTSFPGSFL